MKNKSKDVMLGKTASTNSFSDFFKPQNQENAKEALRKITESANSEQKAVIMGFRGASTAQCC